MDNTLQRFDENTSSMISNAIEQSGSRIGMIQNAIDPIRRRVRRTYNSYSREDDARRAESRREIEVGRVAIRRETESGRLAEERRLVNNFRRENDPSLSPVITRRIGRLMYNHQLRDAEAMYDNEIRRINTTIPDPEELIDNDIDFDEDGNVIVSLSEEKINQLPIVNFSLECCICKDKYKDDHKIKITKCNHSFHKGCIERWLRQSVKCPICRRDQRETE